MMASTAETTPPTTNGDTDTALVHEYGLTKTTITLQNPGDRDILVVRAARGEKTERTPVWLMRQAGRYMSAFREY
jgi:hypothetical protein